VTEFDQNWKGLQMDKSVKINDSEPLTLLTAREAANYLRVSMSTLRRMERRGQLSFLRTPGGHRRYTLEMLNSCLVHTGKAKTEAT
jgi:excisionase family DNA binding protein